MIFRMAKSIRHIRIRIAMINIFAKKSQMHILQRCQVEGPGSYFFLSTSVESCIGKEF